MEPKFQVDDRVSFAVGDITGTGTVLGMSVNDIVKIYIVLLDEPLPNCNYKAITLVEGYLTKL